MKDTNQLIFNDTNEIRGFASDNFNWILDKESCIACCWGKTAKENPEFDPIGPEEIVWKITDFNLNTYTNYFNFITNIHIKENEEQVLPIENRAFSFCHKNIDKLICMSTFSNIVFNIEYSYLNTVLTDFKKFVKYIENFNIIPKFIIEYNDDINLENYINILNKISKNVIININAEFFSYNKLLENLKNLKNNEYNMNLKIHINNNNYGQVHNLVENIEADIPVTLNFDCIPAVSVEKYLKIQQFAKEKNLTNIFITQCSKHIFNKSVIGSILLEIECPAARFAVYIENNKIYPCEYTKSESITFEDCKTIHDFWLNPFFSRIRNNLIDTRVCKK